MGRLATEADQEFQRLSQHYLDQGRQRAAELLALAVEQACARVDQPELRSLPAPRPYPGLAAAGFRWIKIHRHWFAFAAPGDGDATARPSSTTSPSNRPTSPVASLPPPQAPRSD